MGEDGKFLVRSSTNYKGDFTLCVHFEDKVEHYHIKVCSEGDTSLTIDDEVYFEDLVDLVEVSKELPFYINLSCYVFYTLTIL